MALFFGLPGLGKEEEERGERESLVAHVHGAWRIKWTKLGHPWACKRRGKMLGPTHTREGKGTNGHCCRLGNKWAAVRARGLIFLLLSSLDPASF